jgi:hypothetical protein
MRFLTEEQLVRKAVTKGLCRVLCQVYTEEQVGPPTEHIKQLLTRLANPSCAQMKIPEGRWRKRF